MARDSREDYQNYTTKFGSVWDVWHKIFAAIITLASGKNSDGSDFVMPVELSGATQVASLVLLEEVITIPIGTTNGEGIDTGVLQFEGLGKYFKLEIKLIENDAAAFTFNNQELYKFHSPVDLGVESTPLNFSLFNGTTGGISVDAFDKNGLSLQFSYAGADDLTAPAKILVRVVETKPATKLVANEARTPIVESGVLLDEVVVIALSDTTGIAKNFNFDGFGKNLKIEAVILNDDVNYLIAFHPFRRNGNAEYQANEELSPITFSNASVGVINSANISDINRLGLEVASNNDASTDLYVRLRITETSRNTKDAGCAWTPIPINTGSGDASAGSLHLIDPAPPSGQRTVIDQLYVCADTDTQFTILSGEGGDGLIPNTWIKAKTVFEYKPVGGLKNFMDSTEVQPICIGTSTATPIAVFGSYHHE